ncbi:MAG: short-chain dehydrogenase/reductase [Gammaproteobacteria bacterium]|jgi:NAD(P)-dependent dehydrogenase (short-subunit alcohol dehydrogenase family)|nr:short-chain dehydrogenase/reductase [Gammaproteobacteria bacterium]
MTASSEGRPGKPRTWLITGVSSGFGRALAEAALENGDRVAGTVRTEVARRKFEQLAPGRSFGMLLDVTDRAAIVRLVAEVEEWAGGIDVLVNNAGYGLVGGVEEASDSEVRAQFEVNVFGALAVIQAVLPLMRRQRSGRIVCVSSVSGLVGWPSLGIYSGSKFALEGICETLAQEVAPLGIRVILVEPGGLRTDFAGRSSARAAKTIVDYDATVGACKRILAEHAGHEAGDPRKAAQAVLTAVEAESPPLRLLLGADALQYTSNKLAAFTAEMERWKFLSLGIGYDD